MPIPFQERTLLSFATSLWFCLRMGYPNFQIVVIRFSGQTVAVFGISPVAEQSLANDSIQSVGTHTLKVMFTLL